MELNELKYQLDGISSNNGTPAIRIKTAEIREKISDLKYKYNMYVVEREAKMRNWLTNVYVVTPKTNWNTKMPRS
jgi:hypothetical protein